jgi:hypothetical protein
MARSLIIWFLRKVAGRKSIGFVRTSIKILETDLGYREPADGHYLDPPALDWNKVKEALQRGVAEAGADSLPTPHVGPKTWQMATEQERPLAVSD